MSAVLRRIVRRKMLRESDGKQSLARVLTTWDLTSLGVGATLGVGVYVLAGEVARDTAGPAVILSFLIAGVTSLLSAVCYAELGARVPLCGSAYVYSYVAVGEFVAFVIGWNLLLEYIIGTASVARAYSGYLDRALGNVMQSAFRRSMPIHLPFLSSYPDFFAFGITCLLTFILCIGVKESTRFNNIFTCLNICVVLFVTIFGFIHADINNWDLSSDVVVVNGTHYGEGGFFPYGISGVFSGAATCFYGFVGFDAIATSGEEAQNPQKSIPVSLMVSLTVIFVSYSAVSSVMTLMVPYYLEDVTAPLPFAFEFCGWRVGGTVITVGALFGLSTSLLGAMFPLPRIMMAMAQDGLIFRVLSHTHPKLQTPVLATLIGGFITAILAMIFDLASLVDMMSIGTLMAYMMVAASVAILHYQPHIKNSNQGSKISWTKLFNLTGETQPDQATCSLSKLLLAFYMVTAVMGAFLLAHKLPEIVALDPFLTSLAMVTIFLMLLSVWLLWLQPRNPTKLSFKTPLVPFLPSAAIFVNIYLMMKLSLDTWVRFTVWLCLGLMVYGGYGWRNSTEEHRERQERALGQEGDRQYGTIIIS